MSEPTYYKLAKVEEWLDVSRDTLTRCAAAGLLRLDGDRKQRRVLAASYIALKARIDGGESLWQLLKEAEGDQRPSEAKPTEEDRSIRTVKGAGGSSRRPRKAKELPDSAIPAKNAPPWLKIIT